MGICPNAYYNYKKNRKAGCRGQKGKFKNKVLQIYHEYSGNPGYRMMGVYLLRAKISLSNTTVLKYMQELGIRSTVTPKKPAYKKGGCYKNFVFQIFRYIRQSFRASFHFVTICQHLFLPPFLLPFFVSVPLRCVYGNSEKTVRQAFF